MGVFDRILRAGEGRKLKHLEGLVPDIDSLGPELGALSDAALQAKTGEFRQRLDNGEDLDDLLIEAFGVVREAATRVIGQRHFPVQLMGAAALHFGWVAEMKTGEGKTLVSTAPVYLNALARTGVHVITVNDYLADRDADWMGQIHRFMGLSVGKVLPGVNDPEVKRNAYAADITYGTNNEFGFDYLRDNMAPSRERQVQRGHHYAIVDEVDSILIDEARTPLIISGRVADAAELYVTFARIARSLIRDEDYEFDEEKRVVAPLESGIEKVEQALGVDNLYDHVSSNLVHQLQASLKAKELFRRDKDYIVDDGEVKIVDEFTGRILEGRRWSEGLHQAVEAKEGVKIKEENQTLATITLQNYFRLYDKLAGMTGTAETEAAEFHHTYGLDVIPIPTNRALARIDEPDVIYRTEEAKFEAVADDIGLRNEAGQPILVGTVSVENSEKLGKILARRGIPAEILNAKQHHREAEIVTQAGRLGAVTVATNMAGRGVDILLGGNPQGLASRDARAEGLQPNTDEYEARYRELLPKYEADCQTQREKVLELGGLFVLGTERHESRRIDNQLRGRSGRQGDPGASRFYLSLEDDLMRLFATGAMNWVMGKSMPDDIPIEAKMVTKAIERAQNTVEQRNAEIRKNVLKYDEVMNEQRKVIYRRRDQILDGDDLQVDALDALADAIETAVETFCVSDYSEEWDADGLLTEVGQYFPLETTAEEILALGDADAVHQHLYDLAEAHYHQRETELTPEIMRQVERQVMLRIIDQRWREHLYEMDYLQQGIGLRAMGQKDPLVEWQREGFEMFQQMMHGISQDFVKYVMHVQVQVQPPAPQPQSTPIKPGEAPAFTAPAQSVGPSAGGAPSSARPEPEVRQQPDSSLAPRGAGVAPRLGGDLAAAASQPVGEATKADVATALPTFAPAPARSVARAGEPLVKTDEEKLGRNDPCHCGSGKKFKHCHGR